MKFIQICCGTDGGPDEIYHAIYGLNDIGEIWANEWNKGKRYWKKIDPPNLSDIIQDKS